MKKNINLRSLAAQAIEQVVEKGQSLSNVLPPLQQKVSDKDKALLQELCFGVLRTLSQLEWLISKLMARPMTGKQRTVHFLIMVGLYQLLYTRIPPHAALAETVEGAVAIKRPQLKGLINGVLRQFQRQQEALLAEFAEHENRYLHPKWLLKRLQQAWPQQWQEIVEANNQRPPMWLRVNRNHHSRDEWLALLNEAGLEGFTHPDYPDAVRLATPAPVHTLPGFAEGWVTVQDASAQGCMRYLQPENGERILDLCAAPGGKTTQIAALTGGGALITACERNKMRAERLEYNVKKQGASRVTVMNMDARQLDDFFAFDRVLLDAPCSGSGTVTEGSRGQFSREYLDRTVKMQKTLLDKAIRLLKPGHELVYSTCSILPQENEEQIRAFLESHPEYEIQPMGAELPEKLAAHENALGLQMFAHRDGTDGFYVCRMRRVKA